MNTDSETLMREGIRVAEQTFAEFLKCLGWTVGDVDKTFCHQVGRAHRKLMLDSLGVSPEVDYITLETLGNTGSVALPMTAAVGIENGHLQPGDRVGLLGIGSGINVIMLGVEWQKRVIVGLGFGCFCAGGKTLITLRAHGLWPTCVISPSGWNCGCHKPKLATIEPCIAYGTRAINRSLDSGGRTEQRVSQATTEPRGLQNCICEVGVTKLTGCGNGHNR